VKRKFLPIAVILALLCALFGLHSCGGDPGDEGGGEAKGGGDHGTVSTEPEEGASPEERIPTGLPEADLGGYKFRVVSRAENHVHWFARDISAEEETGDPINDAVYRRNKTIEETYNIEIVDLPQRGNPTETAQKAVRAGDDMFDVVSTSLDGVANMGTAGLLFNLRRIPNIDLSKPWWDRQANEQLTIGGRLFGTISNLLILDKDATWVFLFNKLLLQEFQLDDLYQMVKSGSWTMDRLLEMMTVASSDLNGDGTMHEREDRFGLVSENENAGAFFQTTGEKIISLDKNGMPEVTMFTPRALDVCDMIVKLQSNKNITINPSHHDLQEVIFNDNRGLFLYIGMNRVTLLRNMETDFGIIPPPKFDKSQDKYYIHVDVGCTSSVAVPVTVPDIGQTGMILEALTAESHYTLLPAYYDITLKTKFLRDDESSEMLDLIFSNRVYELGHIFNWGTAYNFFDSLNRGSNNLSSWWEKNSEKIQTAMEKSMEKILELD